ncbi:hypothetical protein [Dyadobacter psychrotolerans]|uniref:Uncharacterized protein n=1 Tax=Dyadobacter psychrotolerans TaxID=2541721 RepID=A0A4R5DUU1_9BACT|nr:hypothetical protein [Dyadobacter psychrotolerans]TDE18272.1 hypothetical protein E0F88_01650 [Dyadobacter psychrotolerans]
MLNFKKSKLLKTLPFLLIPVLGLSLFQAKGLINNNNDASENSPFVSMADSCKAGPRIMAITDISSSNLNGQFYGIDIFRISWTIKDPKGTILRQGEQEPGSNNPLITFKPLPTGKYILTYSGKNCTSKPSSKEFIIPVVLSMAEMNARMGTYAPQTVAKGMDEHMNLFISRQNDVYLISDNASAPLGNGYEYRYMIGADIVKSNQPLKNYFFAGNNPLRIWKMKTKVGLESTNSWSDRENNGYYSTSAGEVFSHNTTAAFRTLVFPTVHIKGGFLNPVPENFNPSTQNSQWADIAPDMKLPDGHVWIASPGAWPVEQLRAKGVTHIAKHDLTSTSLTTVMKMKDLGVTYNNVPRIEHFMNLKASGPDQMRDGYNLKFWPKGQLSKEQAIQKANEADISDAIWIGETMEGTSYMPPDAAMWGHFYKRLRERYQEKWEARKIPFYIAHNYFMFWPKEISLSRNRNKEYFKNLLHLPAAQLPKTNFSPGGTLSQTNLITEAVYIGPPDIQQGQVYESIFRMFIIKNLGYESGIFLFGVHEWRPNNLYQYKYPEGTFYASNKLPLDPNVIIANGFIAQVFGKLYVEWGGFGKSTNKNFDPEWTQGVWFPKGATDPQPGFSHYKKPGEGSYPGYTGSSDFSYFSQKLYNDTFGQTDGGIRKFLKYKIDNGNWLPPSQFSAEEIVDAYHDKRGFVFSQTKNGKTAWFYLNSFADNVWHNIEVELPNGTVVKERVAGNGIHVKLQ